MTSSWISAHACSSSSDAAARTTAVTVRAARAAPAPVAERRPQPLAAGQQGAGRLDHRGQLGADAPEPDGLLGDERVQRVLHARAQVLGLQRGRHAASVRREAKSGRSSEDRAVRRGIERPSVPSEDRAVTGSRGSGGWDGGRTGRTGQNGRMAADRAAAALATVPTVGELLARGACYSFEFFPPKTDDGERALWQTLRQLEALASGVRLGHVRRRRLRAGPHRPGHRADRRRDHDDPGRPPHLRGVVGGRAAPGGRPVRGRGRAQRSSRCVATRPPGWARRGRRTPTGCGTRTSWSGWSPGLATSASGSRRSRWGTRSRRTWSSDARRLAGKADAGAEFAVTQFFFDADDYLRLRDRALRHGCDDPDRAGDHADHQLPPGGPVRRARRHPGARRAGRRGSRRSRTTRTRSAPSASRSRPRCAGGCSTRASPGCTSTRSTVPRRPARCTSCWACAAPAAGRADAWPRERSTSPAGRLCTGGTTLPGRRSSRRG